MERKRKIDLETTEETKILKKIPENINPYTKNPYSQRYYDILEKRKQLPVWEQREEFIEKVRNSQVVILVGETGSGKTTQVNIFHLRFSFRSCTDTSISVRLWFY
jgi:HrpA-like RNA helicase